MTAPESIRIGQVRKPVGLRGDLRVESLTDDPKRFRVGMEVRVGDRTVVLERVKANGRELTLKLQGVDDVDAAGWARGKYIEVPGEQVEPLPEGRYYHWQLVGLRAVDPSGAELGEVIDVLEYPANDVLVVRSPAGELLVPAVSAVVRVIDLDKGTMEVALPPEEVVE